jgi:hypothetical protein
LKRVIKRAEKILKKPEIKKIIDDRDNNRPIAEASKGEPTARSAEKMNLLEKTRHLFAMGHTNAEIAEMLNINCAEVDFLQSLHRK